MRKILRLLRSLCKSKKLVVHGKHFRCGKNFNICNGKNILIGDHFLCADNCELSVWNKDNNQNKKFKIIIGDNVTIASYSYISCTNEIKISDGCLLGINTFITDNFHGTSSKEEKLIIPNERKLFSKGPVKIGKNVWIGRNVCIMPNVTIGDYSIIGANAVVTHNVPKNSIAVGVPARVISKLK